MLMTYKNLHNDCCTLSCHSACLHFLLYESSKHQCNILPMTLTKCLHAGQWLHVNTCSDFIHGATLLEECTDSSQVTGAVVFSK